MSATSTRSWLDGTLDVISGKAPRQSSSHGPPRSSSPFLLRVPSDDAMERSSHNDSGHGKSTAQMVKDLRASNAKLTAKTAEMEADFMNQINQVTVKFGEEERRLQESLEKKEQLIKEMESRGVSVENRIRERDTALSKLKEETSFQRHTIADLKNQLYQLQNEVEEAEYDKKDEVSKWDVEKQEMVREMESLKKQFQEFQVENERLRSQLTEKDPSDGSNNVMQSWKKLEESKKENAEKQRILIETKSSLAALEKESKRVQKEQESELTILRAKLAESQVTLSKREIELRSHADTEKINADLKSTLEEREKDISALKEQVAVYAEQVADLMTDNAKLHAEAESHSIYHHDEASDLRILNDSHLEEINRLKEDCDEMERAISERDEALMESMEEADTLQKHVDKLSREIIALQEAHETETEERILRLETALHESNEAYRKLGDDLNELKKQNEHEISCLRLERDKLVAERDDAESRITILEEGRDESRSSQESSLLNGRDVREEEESRVNKRLRDVVASAAKERIEMEKEHDELLADFERAKHEEIASLQRSLDKRNDELSVAHNDLEIVRRACKSHSDELNQLKVQLERAETKMRQSIRSASVEPEETKFLLEKLEQGKNDIAMSQKALRESQIALLALDDEKERVENQLKETRAKWEEQRSELIDHYETQLLVKDEELAQVINRSGDSRNLTEIVIECAKLEECIKRKDVEILMLSKGDINKTSNEHVGAMEEALRRELIAAKDAEEKLTKALARSKSEHQQFEAKVKIKLEDRDTTISTLVKSSVSQEHKLAKMKVEVEALKSQLAACSNTTPSSLRATRSMRTAGNREEIDLLRASVEDCKETEQRLHSEVQRLEKELCAAQNEVTRLKLQLDNDINGGISRRTATNYLQRDRGVKGSLDNDLYETLEERDSAIAALVKQSMNQEAIVKKLNAEVERLKEDPKRRSPRKLLGSQDGPSWDEMKQLQKESEIFASQIIEQDEEIQALRYDVEDRDKEISDLKSDLADLQKELATARNKATPRDRDLDRIDELQAELDEMQEANETQRQEIRELRRQIRDSQTAFDTVDDLRLELELANKAMSDLRSKTGASAKEDASLRDELNAAIACKDAAEERLAQEMETMRKMRVAAVDELDAKLRERDEIIEELTGKHASTKGDIEGLKNEVQRLKIENELKSSIAEDAKTSLQELRKIIDEKTKPDEEKAALTAENSSLVNEINALKDHLATLEEDMVSINKLKARLHEAENGRENGEKSIMDSYERKITLMKLNTEVTIDNIRKELLEAKTQNSEIEAEMLKHIKAIELENKDLKDELEAKLQLKNSKIDALEQTLVAQEQLVENMRQEMDHLQGSMERSTIGRRAEIEEMQQEVIDSTGKAQKLEREITSLKMKLEQRELEYESQMNKMEERLGAMQESPLARTMTKETTDRIADLKEKFENLKWRNTSLQEENKSLRLKLERAQEDFAVMKNDVYRASALEKQNENLEKRVEGLEGEKSVWTSSTALTSRPQSSNPSPQSNNANNSKPPTPAENSKTRASSRARSGSAPRGVKAPSSPSMSRKTMQTRPESPGRSSKTIVPSSPGRFFLKRRPSNSRGAVNGETPKDDNSAASKLTF